MSPLHKINLFILLILHIRVLHLLVLLGFRIESARLDDWNVCGRTHIVRHFMMLSIVNMLGTSNL